MKLNEINDKEYEDFFTKLRGFDEGIYLKLIVKTLDENKGVALQGINPPTTQIEELAQKTKRNIEKYLQEFSSVFGNRYNNITFIEKATNKQITIVVRGYKNGFSIHLTYGGNPIVYNVEIKSTGMFLYHGYSQYTLIMKWT